jgi:hypothetical protein
MRLNSAPLAFILAVILVAPVLAQKHPYFPTDTGTSWEYQVIGGETYWMTVTGTETFFGQAVIRLDSSLESSAGPYYFSGKYTLDAAGSVYMVGWEYLDAAPLLTSVYSPHILVLPSTAQMPPMWQVDFIDTSYWGDQYRDEFSHSYTYSVQANEEISVPAGTYHTIRISRESYGGSEYIYWYALGVGIVQTQDSIGRLHQLSSFQDGQVRTESRSWARLKSMYGDL